MQGVGGSSAACRWVEARPPSSSLIRSGRSRPPPGSCGLQPALRPRPPRPARGAASASWLTRAIADPSSSSETRIRSPQGAPPAAPRPSPRLPGRGESHPQVVLDRFSGYRHKATRVGAPGRLVGGPQLPLPPLLGNPIEQVGVYPEKPRWAPPEIDPQAHGVGFYWDGSRTSSNPARSLARPGWAKPGAARSRSAPRPRSAPTRRRGRRAARGRS